MAVFDGFVNPALIAGAALAAVPLVIHLLNRQRFKPLPWAAMRFVLAAYRKTRRRARLENLLLLLLRMAAIALLAFAIARPFTGERSPLAALAQNRRDVVLVLDGSASTGYRAEVKTSFERIVERAKEIVLELDGTRDDRVRVLVAGARPRLIAWRRPEEALSVLATLTTPTDEPLDLAAALGEVVRYVEEDAAHSSRTALEIRLLTDLQKRNFEVREPAPDAAAAAAAPALTEQLDALAKLHARIEVEDLGARELEPPNLGIASIELLAPVLGPQAPVDVAVSVRNFGAVLRSGVRVSLSIDGTQKLPYRPLDIAARGTAQATFPVVFASSGAHVLTAKLESDRLAVDDERAQVVRVPPTVRVLLVDGEVAADVERDEVGLLFAVLDPPRGDEVLGGAGSAPFDARVVEPHELREEALDLADFDVIVLANVESLPPDVIEKLERRTAAGAALVFTLGKRVEPESYNARLFKADGSGLLPLELGQRISIPRKAGQFRVRDFEHDHPALAFFTDPRWQPLLTEAPVYEFFASRPHAGAKVLARLDDDAASPLFVEKSYDRGKVFVWSTSIDPEWTRLPDWPWAFVPLIHEWFRYGARPSQPPRNVAVGGALIAEVASFPRSPVLLLPDGSRRALEGAAESIGPGAWRVAALDATERSGVYRIEFEGAGAEPFAAQLDAREGDLARLSPSEIAAWHSVLQLVGSEIDTARGDEEPPARGEIWRWIAILCFAVLVLEALWAAWLGRARRLG